MRNTLSRVKKCEFATIRCKKTSTTFVTLAPIVVLLFASLPLPRTSSSEPRARPVAIEEHAVPALTAQHFKSSGTYPVIMGRGTGIQWANREIQRRIVADQDGFVQSIAKNLSDLPSYAIGLYKLYNDPSLISASSQSMSVLIPESATPPLGDDGATWFAITEDISSKQIISILSLFSNSKAALVTIEKYAKLQILTGNSLIDQCVKTDYQQKLNVPFYNEGFAPTSENYQTMALVPSGLAVGYPNGQIASPACGRIEITVPYDIVQSEFNAQGIQLRNWVRAPRFAH